MIKLKFILLLLISSCWGFKGHGQGKDSLKIKLHDKAIFELVKPANLMRVDNLGQIYLVEDDEILKLNAQGDTLFTSSNKLSGQITDLDVSFALKPLLFHKNQNAISILDNTLHQQGAVVELNNFDIFQATAVCNSFSGNIVWVFNLDNWELIKLNRETGIVYNSGNLKRQLDIGDDISQLIEYKNQLYMNCGSKGLLVFDIYGTYIQKLPLYDLEQIQVTENSISGLSSKGLIIYNRKDFTSTLVDGSTGFNQVSVHSGKVYLQDEEKLTIKAIQK